MKHKIYYTIYHEKYYYYYFISQKLLSLFSKNNSNKNLSFEKRGAFYSIIPFSEHRSEMFEKKKRGDLKGEKYNLTKKKKEKLLLIFFNSIQIPSSRPEFCNSDIISLNINEPINLHKNSSRR